MGECCSCVCVFRGDGSLCIAVMLQLCVCVFRGAWGVVYCCNAAVVCVFLGGDGGMLQLCVCF